MDELYICMLWEGGAVSRAGIAIYNKVRAADHEMRRVSPPRARSTPARSTPLACSFPAPLSTPAVYGDVRVCSLPCNESDLEWTVRSVRQHAGDPALPASGGWMS